MQRHADVLEESYGSNPVPFSIAKTDNRDNRCTDCRRDIHCNECRERDNSSESHKRCEGADCSRTENYRPQVEYI